MNHYNMAGFLKKGGAILYLSVFLLMLLVSGGVKAAEVSPTSLDFFEVLVHTISGQLPVTVSNTSVALEFTEERITSITTSGDFSQTNDCPLTLLNPDDRLTAGQSCTVQVTFWPRTAGAASGSLTVSGTFFPHLPSNSFTRTVNLSGTGVEALLLVSPEHLDFGEVPVGTTSQTQQVTISNAGGASLTIREVLAAVDDGGGLPEFSQTNNCPSVLGGGQSCTAQVTFSPTRAGDQRSALFVGGTGADGVTLIGALSELTGTGTQEELSVSPGNLDFGSVPVGTTSQAQQVTISNAGGASLTIREVVAGSGEHPLPTGFSQTNNCPSVLGGGQSCTAQVTFSPTRAGDQIGALSVFGTGADGVTFISAESRLAGTGIQAGLAVSTGSLDFGGVPVDTTSQAQPVTISNAGGASLTIENIAASGGYGQTNNCPSVLSGGQSCTVQVTFSPTTAAVINGGLTISGVGADGETPISAQVTLTGTGTQVQELSVSPDSLNPDGTAPGGTVSSTFAVSDGTPPYSIAVTSGPGSVTPDSLTSPGQVTFSHSIPTGTPSGPVNSTITVTDAGGTSRQVQVTMDVVAPASDPISSRPDLTSNERSVAVTIETACPALAGVSEQRPLTSGEQDLFEQCSDMLSNADSTGIPNTLNQITTEKARASTSTSIEVGTQQLANVGSRLAALRRGAAGVDFSGLSLNIDGQSISGRHLSSFLSAGETGGGASGDAESAFGDWGFFINGNFNFGDKDETDKESGFDFDTKGITAGADYRFSDKFILGGALGYAKNDVDFSSGGGDLDTDSWSLSAYGTYYLSDQIYLDGILGYGWNDFQSKRNITYQVAETESRVNRTARSDYDGSQFGGSLGTGYNFNRDAFEFGVYGRLNYLKVDVDGFRETQAAGLNLRVHGFDATSLTTTVGGRISRAFSTQKAVIVPQARFEWEHEFDNDASTLAAQFVNDPTATAFAISTDDPDRNYFRLGLGVSAVFTGGVITFVNYNTILDKDDWSDHAIDVGVKWEF